MKKATGILVLAVLFLLLFASCGTNGAQEEQVKAQLTALEALCTRAGAAVTGINATTASSSGLVNANFNAYYDALATDYDSFALSAEEMKALPEQEVASLLESLEAKNTDAKPTVESLETIATEFETLAANAKALVNNLTQVIPLAVGNAASPEQQQEYTEVAAAYQGIESQLNGILAQPDSGDLAATLESLRQANAALAALTERVATLLTGLQAQLG